MKSTFKCLLIMTSSLIIACSDDKKGEPLGLPQVKPPVERNTPSGLKSSTALWLQASTSSSLKTMGSRFFTNGPTSIMDILDKIDTSLSGLDQRSQSEGKERPECLESTPISWNANLPSGTVTFYLQCSEESQSPETSTTRKMAFGIKDDYVYLVNMQESTGQAPRGGTLVKAKMDGSLTEAWMTLQKFDLSQTVSANDFFFLNVKADDTTKAFEFSVGGTGKGIGVDCGVRVRSNGSQIYATGIFASLGDRGIEDCSGVAGTSKQQGSSDTNYNKETLCVDASSMGSIAESQCSGINSFTVPELTHLGLKANGKSLSDAIITSSISEIPVFQPKK